MAIISCPECGRQVSDKALKCPQCAHPIANPNFQRESNLDHLQLLQEKIQEKLKDLCITVKIISVGNNLNIKLTRPAWLRINKSPTLSQVWIQIKPELTQDVLRGFNNLLITSTFEGDIKSEWERQSDIDSTGKILPNKEEKTALQRWLKLLGISVAETIMAKLVPCKTCKREVAKDAKTCPYCGTASPGINLGKGCLTILVGSFVFGGCSMLWYQVTATPEQKRIDKCINETIKQTIGNQNTPIEVARIICERTRGY